MSSSPTCASSRAGTSDDFKANDITNITTGNVSQLDGNSCKINVALDVEFATISGSESSSDSDPDSESDSDAESVESDEDDEPVEPPAKRRKRTHDQDPSSDGVGTNLHEMCTEMSKCDKCEENAYLKLSIRAELEREAREQKIQERIEHIRNNLTIAEYNFEVSVGEKMLLGYDVLAKYQVKNHSPLRTCQVMIKKAS